MARQPERGKKSQVIFSEHDLNLKGFPSMDEREKKFPPLGFFTFWAIS